MRLFLVRHGETVDNVAGVYAGITDSALTNHGVLQANRLGLHLAATGVVVSHLFSSDLMRAFKTAEAIRLAQPQPVDEHAPILYETKQLATIREQDFGSLEGKTFNVRSGDSKKTGKESYSELHKKDADFKDVETKDAMRARSDKFIEEHLSGLFSSAREDHIVVVVAHGIILTILWRCILRRFPSLAVSVAPGVVAPDRELTLEHLGGWSNTGYLELEIKPQSGDSQRRVNLAINAARETTPPAESKAGTAEGINRVAIDKTLVVKAVNSMEHLRGLKKTRGGIGSLKHDEGQKTIESFFKKRKLG